MSQIDYRANISAKTFPLLSEQFGRSVIVGGPDQNFNRQLYSPDDPDKDVGIPQIYYAHNVMPTSSGFASIGYDANTLGVNGETAFNNIFILRDAAENKAYFCHTVAGKNYIHINGDTSWTLISTIAAPGKVSVAYVSGESYIYFEGVGCYKYDFASSSFISVTLTSLVPANILGITSSQGYLIAWSETEVVWSSTIDPTDFTPSLETGAGGGSVQGVKGIIVTCISNPLGFIVYTTINAVAALYSGNSRYPFNFKELVGCGGIATAELAAYGAGASAQYAYTTSGLQLVSTVGTRTVFPEITDFLAGEYFEDFNEDTLEFSTSILSSPMLKKLTVISDRYLVISYGIAELTHCLVYDLAQERLGKLKLTHVDCFEAELLSPEVVETPRKSIGFLQKDGTIKTVNFSVNTQFSSGVILLGKYQYVRTRLLQLDGVSIENVRYGGFLNVYSEYTLDGKTLLKVKGTPVTSPSGTLNRDYTFHTTGINHSLLMIGQFYLVSLVLSFNVHGKR